MDIFDHADIDVPLPLAVVEIMLGLTIDDIKQGASRIRNPVIARVFKELNLIEQWGTGVRRIFSEASELALPEPKIEEIALRFRFTVYLKEPHHILIGEKKIPSGSQPIAQVEAQVEAQVDLRVLQACARHPLSSSEIASALGHKTLSGNVRKVLPILREAGLLEYTIPGKPTSRLQKYRLTAQGQQVLERVKSEKDLD